MVTQVDSHTHLGSRIQSNGKWEYHINDITAKTNYKLVVLRKFKPSPDRKTREIIYPTYIRPTMAYSNIIWNNCTQYHAERLEQLQLEAARIVTGSVRGTKHKYLYLETGWLPLSQRRINNQLIMMYKMINHLAPPYLSLLVSRPG